MKTISTYENDIFINENTTVRVYLQYIVDNYRIKVVDSSFFIYGLDKYDCLDIDYSSEDNLSAETPTEAAQMVKKWAEKYCPEDLERIENNFNTRFFEKFLQNCVSDLEETW